VVEGREIERIEDLLSRHLTWEIIEGVVFEYPREYLFQGFAGSGERGTIESQWHDRRPQEGG
jgi:hypothetical protein